MDKKLYFKLFTVLLFSSCATYSPQYKYENNPTVDTTNKEIEHSFYLIGSAGSLPIGGTSEALKAFEKELSAASKNSTALFLGDNMYPNGLPKKDHKNRANAEHQLNVQTATTLDFKGRSIVIPGNRDWYSKGVEGLKRQEKYIEDILGKNTFLPENGCPIEKIHVSNDIELILIDSQWFITNWDLHPTINDNCDIKTRHAFFDEYSSLIKKARGKTTIVAIHHPMYTNGPRGGQFSLGDHMKPLPIVGTIKNILRKTSGMDDVDLQNKQYNQLKKRLVTISQENKKVIFVSGHEHSLQYIVEDNLHQIVSGAGSKQSATRNVGGGLFSYGAQGYAVLDVYKDGSSHVRFHSVKDAKVVFETEVLPPSEKTAMQTYPSTFPKEKTASIYTEEETKASGIRKFLWGNRYRKAFGTQVTAPTVNLDTMYGGLKVVRKGGGNQSKSLRLEDKNGAQYVMRALRKNAVQYLQAVMFKEQYIEGQFDDTATEDLILDIFAGSHPYAPFTIGTLSDAVGIYHTNPTLYYIPKQKTLGNFNDEFGDELYMIEEHTSEGHSDLASFGFQDEIISTDDVMKKLHKDEDIVMDEASYIRARLFDMLIGDWDRHQDQWRWIEFKENGKKVYRPLPRDRDQAFSIMSDGFILGAAVTVVPTARLLRKYSDDLKDVKGVNVEPYPLDMELIQSATKEVWDQEVRVIQNGITDEVIEEAFLNFPKEVRDESIEDIKSKLKARRGNLQAIADRYFDLVNKYAVIKGTNKDDYFTIECLDNGQVKILAQRIKGGEKADVFHERIYSREETKEIWIYGLDDDDIFEASGKNSKIKIRLIGGQNNDTYIIPDGGKIVVYDYKTKKNDISQVKNAKVKLNDSYDVNVYDYKKLKNGASQTIPFIGFNPDDGLQLGANATYTTYGFERNPFTTKTSLFAAYYFATQGYELGYTGEFANVIGNLNLGINVTFNSPNYAINFFGYGNSTRNPEADDDDGFDTDLDYNRVKIRTIKAKPTLIWRGHQGARITAGVFFESNEVERTEGRFLDDIVGFEGESSEIPVGEDIFDKQDFYGVDAAYHFVNKDNAAFPTLGMTVGLQAGYKNNVSTSKGFGYVLPELGFDYKLIPSGQLVLGTMLRGHINIGDDFEFYQGAALGGSSGLRGYRNQRFTGKSSFVHSTDVRLNLLKLKTAILPISLGVFGGADYGRVWVDDRLAFNTAFNNDQWNTSFGGGMFVNLAEIMTANLAAFSSDDGIRLAFRMGFGL